MQSIITEAINFIDQIWICL